MFKVGPIIYGSIKLYGAVSQKRYSEYTYIMIIESHSLLVRFKHHYVVLRGEGLPIDPLGTPFLEFSSEWPKPVIK